MTTQEDLPKGSGKLETYSGYVGIFDILGYQNFVDNNSVEDAARIVLQAIASLETEVPELTRKTFYKQSAMVGELINQTECLVLSDTLILHLPERDTEQLISLGTPDGVERDIMASVLPSIRLATFVIRAAILCRQMFAYGLPVRGVLNYGDYYLEKNCLFGRPIMDAYRKMIQLDLAACVLTPSAGDRYRELAPSSVSDPRSLWNFLGDFYLVPMKDGSAEKLFAVNFTIRKLDAPNLVGADITQTTLEAFWAHHKDIAQSVLNKATNTANLLRFLKLRFPGEIR